MATFEVDVCEGVDAAGRSVRYEKPERFPVDANQVRLVGTYVGPNQNAWGSIYLDPPSNSSVAVVLVHTVQPPMTIRQRMLAANASPTRMAPQPQAIVQPVMPVAAAARLAPTAPVLKPRTPTTSGAGSGGF